MGHRWKARRGTDYLTDSCEGMPVDRAAGQEGELVDPDDRGRDQPGMQEAAGERLDLAGTWPGRAAWDQEGDAISPRGRQACSASR